MPHTRSRSSAGIEFNGFVVMRFVCDERNDVFGTGTTRFYMFDGQCFILDSARHICRAGQIPGR
jgi:hypothetical protein